MEPAPGKESSSTHWSIATIATCICALLFFHQEIFILGAVSALVSGYSAGRLFYAGKDRKANARGAL
jgi:hypothetical protein